MKITSLDIKDYKPIKNLQIDDLGDIVIIAGANGSGKTRLKEAIVQTLQGNPQISMTLRATRKEENTSFGGEFISVKQGERNQTLTQYIQNRRFGGRARYVGSLVQIDSDRNIQTVSYSQVDWLGKDPDDVDTPQNWGYQKFTDRWQDFMNYIHQKYAVRDKKLAEAIKRNPTTVGNKILEQNPDPLKKYKEIFAQLLPDKKLEDIKPESPREFYYEDTDGSVLPFSSLSSGEQEVVKVIFDVARKDIKHSVIIVDEPELHLHPSLTFKLVETLKNIGDHTNQYIFLTHSANLISTYYSTGNVYFIDTEQSGANQAHQLSELNRTHSELVRVIGENLGIFSVGKKLIFIEGENSSIDQLTYHAIAQKCLSQSKIIPIGSVENLVTLNAFEEQIRNSIFGIDFFMIRDRDGLTVSQISLLESNGRIRCLGKRHLENYFLDPEILFKVAEKLYITSGIPNLTKELIENKIKEIASESLKLNLLQNTKEFLGLNHKFNVPTVKTVDTKTFDEIKSEMVNNIQSNLSELNTRLSSETIGRWMNNEQLRLEQALSNDTWKDEFQGKYIFSQLCGGVLKHDQIKVRHCYIDTALEEKPEIFQDIKDILKSFNGKS